MKNLLTFNRGSKQKKTFKPFFLIIILAILLWKPTFSQETEKTDYKNEIGVGFFQFFVNTFYMGYEHFFNSSSIVINGGFTLYEDYYEEAIGGSAEVQYRFYSRWANEKISFLQIDGLYLSPYANYKYIDLTEYEEEWVGQTYHTTKKHHIYPSLGGGVLIGIKFFIVERLTVDFNLGGGVKYTFKEEERDLDYSYSLADPGYTGILPKANLVFGIRF